MPNEGQTPEDEAIEANTFERTVSINFEEDALRVDTSRDIEFLLPAEQSYTDIVRGNLGASDQPFFGAPLGALSSDKTASIRRQETLLTPQLLVRELASATITELSDAPLDGVNHHRITASIDADVPPWTLYINAETGTLSKLETQELDFYQRDSTLEVFYEDWQAAGTTAFPRSLRLVRGAHTLLSEDVTLVTVNPTFDADAFEFPAGITPTFDAALYARGQLSTQWYYLLDAIGLPLAIHVSAANVNDGVAGFDLLWQMDQESKRLSLVRADHAYQGEFQVAASYYKWQVEITQKPESQKGFVPQKGRWQVERSFAWLNFFRRLDKDHEKTVHSPIAFNQLAFVVIILANLSI